MNNIVCRLLLAEARTMSMNKTHRDIRVNNQKNLDREKIDRK